MNWVRVLSGDYVDCRDIFFRPVRIDGNDH